MKAGEMFVMMKGFLSDYLRYRKEVKKHDAWIKKFAGKKGYRYNPHWMFYTNLKIWLAESNQTFGRRYCPCFEPGEDAEVNTKLLCPCAYAEAEIARRGVCHCVLFGRGDLTDEGFKDAEANLMQEYRGTPLSLKDGVLDTRGKVMDPLRKLPIPDSLHQVKRALGGYKGARLDVIVNTGTEAANLERFAKLRGMPLETRTEDGAYRVILDLKHQSDLTINRR
jgi:ferredoxin-thioredoxin reductase catalytic subunit